MSLASAKPILDKPVRPVVLLFVVNPSPLTPLPLASTTLNLTTGGLEMVTSETVLAVAEKESAASSSVLIVERFTAASFPAGPVAPVAPVAPAGPVAPSSPLQPLNERTTNVRNKMTVPNFFQLFLFI